MTLRNFLFPFKSRLDEERRRGDALHCCEQRATNHQNLIRQTSMDNLLLISKLLDRIQTQYAFYRFQFILGKYDDVLFLVCYGDHPDLGLYGQLELDNPKNLTTEIYPISANRNPYLRLYLTLRPNLTARIDDIEVTDINNGYGSAAWILTESILQQFSYHKVSGWLSPVDKDHRVRQIHFYEKLGFTVSLKGNGGNVTKDFTKLANTSLPTF